MTNQVPRWLAHLELLGKTEGFLTFLQISQASIPLPRSDDSRSANNSACRLHPYPHPDRRSSANPFVNQQPVTRNRTCRRRTSVQVSTAIRYFSPAPLASRHCQWHPYSGQARPKASASTASCSLGKIGLNPRSSRIRRPSRSASKAEARSAVVPSGGG